MNIDTAWEKIQNINDFLRFLQERARAENLNSLLQLELAWQLEVLSLLTQSSDFQINTQFKSTITADFLNANKFKVNSEVLKNWALEIDSLEVGD
mmetsp:Transcript_17769/g.16999  ORF Transcript_17769/g.16999 Transcript_17769/m.16999 type:complete len:95 (-) Transcript_17769:524-808(-)